MPDEPINPLDVMRIVAEQAAANPPVDTPEYGRGTRSLPVNNVDAVPLTTRMRKGPLHQNTPEDWAKLYGETTKLAAPTLEEVVNDVVLASKHLTDAEWLLLRSRVGRLLGFLPDHTENDDSE